MHKVPRGEGGGPKDEMTLEKETVGLVLKLGKDWGGGGNALDPYNIGVLQGGTQ